MTDAKDLQVASLTRDLRLLQATTDAQIREQVDAAHRLALARVQTQILGEQAQQAQHLRTAVDARLHAIAALDGGAHTDAVARITASIDALTQLATQQQTQLARIVEKLPDPVPFDLNRRNR